MLYLTTVHVSPGFCERNVGTIGKGDSKLLEQIQKCLLRYMHYRNFGYYEQNITYIALYMGYELTSLKMKQYYIVSGRHTQLKS